MSIIETIHVACVCASNQNRSMETHGLLAQRGFRNVKSFGTNSQVKMPGPSIDKPNAYPFSTTYEEIYQDLKTKDEQFYRERGLLSMLARNKNIKLRPQKFQEHTDEFDIIVTFEDHVFDKVVEDLRSRDSSSGKAVHVFNLNVKDTPEEATLGAMAVYKFLTELLDMGEEWEDKIDEHIEEYGTRTGKQFMHTVLFY